MFKIDNALQKPIYKQVIDETKNLIAKGMLKENDKMPSVREFAKMLNVNISTIQKAYQELEKERIIITIVGKGTFITDNFDMIKPNYELIDSLLEELVREAKIRGLTKRELVEKINEAFK
ncbi:GntR family transcriptional regulator [Gemella cuniculi]|uniref:GntR family transcriptional regulator n=1 Tax=Gemella cuniculi TaxID=150240 RepID=UPI00041FF495|nr:GntR family transcriptional regulator [Gemella cuniculi]